MWQKHDTRRTSKEWGGLQRDNEYQPGDNAPATGKYEELNVFGARTGKWHHAQEGEPLPPAPRGYSWRRIPEGC
jgi:hypothetical protein